MRSEEPTIHNQAEHTGTWEPTGILRGYRVLGDEVHRLVVAIEKTDDFFHLPAYHLLPPLANLAEFARNYHLPGKSFSSDCTRSYSWEV